MRERVISIGSGSLTLTVKKVKGKLYVYDQFRIHGQKKPTTIYIGPLEEMVRVYQLYKSMGKVEKISKRDLRRLAKILLEEYMKKINVVNSPRIHSKTNKGVVRRPGFEPGVSGLGGRRPIDSTTLDSINELTTQQNILPQPFVDNSLINGFREWLQGIVTPETARDYTNVINKKLWPPRHRSHVRAWRKYVKYLFSIGRITWEQLQHYNLFLKTPKTKKSGEKRIDDSIIIEYFKKMREKELTTIAILLLGGARLKHIVLMLKNYNPREVVKHPHGAFEPRLYCSHDFCRYYMGIRSGSKRCDYIYYPRIKLEKQELVYTKLKDILSKQLNINAKIFRKYANQRLEELAHKHNITKDAVNLIVSRELSVTGGHYLDTRNWSDKLFSLYIQYLRKQGIVF